MRKRFPKSQLDAGAGDYADEGKYVVALVVAVVTAVVVDNNVTAKNTFTFLALYRTTS